MISIECNSRQTGIGKVLSNLTKRSFIFDDVQCNSIEGVLQSFKCFKNVDRESLCLLDGYKAFKTGQQYNSWKNSQLLYWNGSSYPRVSEKYFKLLERLYDAAFDQCDEYVQALIESGHAILTHAEGKYDQTDSVLTQTEYILNLYRLRAKAQQFV